jgi:hypothetical protein
LAVTVFYGVYAIALGQVLEWIISTFINAYPNKKLLNYSYNEQWNDIMPSLLLSLVMGAVVYSFKWLGLSVLITLIIQVCVGVILYVGMAWMFKLECFNYIYGDIYGKGNEKVAVQAYVEAYEEIILYEEENNIVFDYIFHASGTGTTQTGLICGSLLHGDDRKIIGISVARDAERGYDVIADNILAYMERQEDTAKIIHFEDKYVAGGYGNYNNQIED